VVHKPWTINTQTQQTFSS